MFERALICKSVTGSIGSTVFATVLFLLAPSLAIASKIYLCYYILLTSSINFDFQGGARGV